MRLAVWKKQAALSAQWLWLNAILAELLGASLLRTSQQRKIKLHFQLQHIIKAERGVLGCEQSKGTTLPKLKIKQAHNNFFSLAQLKQTPGIRPV